MNLLILILSILFRKEIKLIVDGTILRVANIVKSVKDKASKEFVV